MYAAEASGLSRSFRSIYNMQNLNIKVPEGTVYGFTGNTQANLQPKS